MQDWTLLCSRYPRPDRWFSFNFRLQFGGTLENIGVSGIGVVGEGMGMGFKHSKDDPMQLSDILPQTLMYDKMRPPKVEGEVTNWMLNTTPLSHSNVKLKQDL